LGIARETGWNESQILDMPLSRGLQYNHAILVSNGLKTIWARNTTGLESARDQFDSVLKKIGVI
jgi:hypothetical protein